MKSEISKNILIFTYLISLFYLLLVVIYCCMGIYMCMDVLYAYCSYYTAFKHTNDKITTYTSLVYCIKCYIVVKILHMTSSSSSWSASSSSPPGTVLYSLYGHTSRCFDVKVIINVYVYS